MHFEELIEALRGFGPYQRLLITVISFTKVTFVPSMLMMAFAGREPDWWCDTSDKGETSERPSNHSFKNESYQNCNWNGTCKMVFSDDMVTVVSEWGLVCDQKWVTNTIISIQMGGVMIGGFLGGYCADAYGRKRMLFAAVLIHVVANGITIFSVSWIMFGVLRIFIGLSAGIHLAVNYLYQVEFIGTKWRTLVGTFPAWPIGIMLLSGLAKWIHNWKWLHLATALLSLPFLCCHFFIPESIRWLVVKGRLDEANRVIRKMSEVNKRPVPDTSFLAEIAEEEKFTRGTTGSYTYKDLFRTKHLAKTTIISCFSWFCCSIIYYGIMFGLKDMSGNFYLNMLLMAITELPVSFVFLGLAALLSRRILSCTTFFFAAAFSFGLVVATRFAPEDVRGTYVNACAMATKFSINLAWTVMHVQSIEQFPTVIRSLGVGALNTATRIGGVLASQLLSLGQGNDFTPTFITMGVLASVTSFSVLFLSETRDKALEDTLKTFIVNKGNQDDNIHWKDDAGSKLNWRGEPVDKLIFSDKELVQPILVKNADESRIERKENMI